MWKMKGNSGAVTLDGGSIICSIYIYGNCFHHFDDHYIPHILVTVTV